MWQRRMQEIQARRLEIQKTLEGDDECDVAALQTELQTLATEYAGLEQRMSTLQGLRQRAAEGAPIGGNAVPNPAHDPIAAGAQRRNANPQGDAEHADDPYSTVQYRQAFMRYVTHGEDIPQQFRADATTKTTDAGSVIPTTVMNKIVEKMESVGMILPLVTRTAFKGGVSIPTSSVKPVATWVTEGSGSDKQKKTTGSLAFQYYKLRCAVAITAEMDVMALSTFEATLINNVVEAMTKALEQAIVSGTGTGRPKGILTETPATGQTVTVAEPSYQALLDAEAALPMAYESAAMWCMSKATFIKFFGLLDSNGQPIGRTNYGIAGRPERFLLGRPVVCCDYVTSFSTSITNGTAFAFLFDFKDYTVNSNMEMRIKKYEDDDTDDMVTKAIMLVDGKVVDNGSLVVLKKGAGS